MASPYGQYENPTEKEKIYIRSHPHHVNAIKESKDKAFSETEKIFGINGRNDESDAFRHCYWSALLSETLGYSSALEFTNAHESSPKNPPDEKKMDLHNNSVGLKIGQNKNAKTSLSLQCQSALRGGKLRVIAP